MKLRDSTFKLFSINGKETEPEKITQESDERLSHDDFSCVCWEEEALTAADCEEILVKGSSFFFFLFICSAFIRLFSDPALQGAVVINRT